jgi:metal-responsive CopG/Arc/MetJ family transcriptional regulator
MVRAKIAITLEAETLARIDKLVGQRVFPSRSQAIQEALAEKLDRLAHGRLARECAKLDPTQEKAMADEGLATEGAQWPKY